MLKTQILNTILSLSHYTTNPSLLYHCKMHAPHFFWDVIKRWPIPLQTRSFGSEHHLRSGPDYLWNAISARVSSSSSSRLPFSLSFRSPSKKCPFTLPSGIVFLTGCWFPRGSFKPRFHSIVVFLPRHFPIHYITSNESFELSVRPPPNIRCFKPVRNTTIVCKPWYHTNSKFSI